FKTPLTIMKSSLDIMKIYTKNISGHDEVKLKLNTKIEKTEKEITMLNRLVNEVLQLELMESGNFNLKKKRIDVGKFVEQVIRKFNLGERLNLSKKLDPELEVFWDPILMECVLENLIDNAIKYGNDKPFDVRVEQKNGHILLEVEDYGIGIPPNEIDSIFKPFFRAKNAENIKGTGFGLVAVEKFVFQHDGEVKVSSAPNKGTKFSIRI
ncbi:MAG: sensor histidine kinase, partial [Cyclobacteriaceae bacterium]